MKRRSGFAFAFDTARVMSGVALGHLAIVLIAPILTRVVSPIEMGEFGLFTAYLAVLTVIASFGFETAAVGARTEEDSLRLVGASLVLTVCVAFATAIIFSIGAAYRWFGPLPFWFPIILGFAAIVSNGFSSLQYLFVRHGSFGRISAGSFLTNVGRALAQLIGGVLGGGGFGLVLGDSFGRVFGLVAIDRDFLTGRTISAALRTPQDTVRLMREQYKCAVFYMPAALLDALIHWMPIPAVGIVYGVEAAGHIALVQRVLSAPIALFGKSIADVFHSRLRGLLKDSPRRIVPLTLMTLGAIAVIFVPASLALYGFGRPAFGFIFGREWLIAGQMGEIMAPMIVVQVAAPIMTRLLVIVREQQLKLLFNTVLFLILFGLFWAAALGGWDLFVTITALSLIVVGGYILWFAVSLWAAWRRLNKEAAGLG